jgi:hypothetical protein
MPPRDNCLFFAHVETIAMPPPIFAGVLVAVVVGIFIIFRRHWETPSPPAKKGGEIDQKPKPTKSK